jgi:hypothetical protein
MQPVGMIEKALWIMLSGLLVAVSVAFTIFQIVQFHLCATAALGTDTAQSCSPAGSRGAIVVGLVILAISGAILAITVALVRRRPLR